MGENDKDEEHSTINGPATIAIGCGSAAVAVGAVLIYFLISYWIEADNNKMPMWRIILDDVTKSQPLDMPPHK
jgi:hypothetical protein